MKIQLKVGDYCVYRTHGVCQVQDIKTINIAGKEEKCLILYIEKDKATVTVPYKFKENGDIRNLLTVDEMETALKSLGTGIRKLKGMWSRRAKEYRDKINTGSITETVDVLRSLIRDVDEEKRSFSERMIYDSAVYRLASEYAIIKHITYQEAEEYVLRMTKNESNSENNTGVKEA